MSMPNVTNMRPSKSTKSGNGMTKWIVILVALAILAMVFYFGCTTRIPAGYTGIVTTFGRVEEKPLEAGFHLKLPVQNIVLMDNREQKRTFPTQAFSSDIQQVEITASINFNIDKPTAMTLYKEIGTGYYETLILPRSLENIKAVFSKYSAERLVAERENLSRQILDVLGSEMSRYGININSISLEDIDFTDAFTNAVEEKQVAEQQKLKAKTQQEQKILEAEAEAKRKVIAAEAEAEVVKVQAESAKFAGEREAEVNRKLSESLTSELVQYYYANKWNGQLPNYMGGETSIPMLNFGSTMNSTSAKTSANTPSTSAAD
ncbi:prohibitin family protein [Eubacteriales bacterium OttesenSCG-928-N13]|nr:prohibitin family protein [Eubacteriales bacterium OttesenSCG-928-N13]